MSSFLTASLVYRGNCFREACTRVNRYNGLNRWNNIYVSGAVRVVVFMSNGSARALSDNGSGVLSIICQFIKPNPCNMTSAALVVC